MIKTEQVNNIQKNSNRKNQLMKKIFIIIILLNNISCLLYSQSVIYPAKENKSDYFITNGTIHVGNGQIISNGIIEVSNNKIVKVGSSLTVPSGAKVIDAKGGQIYPGMISAISNLGLKEVGNGVRGSNDYAEIGDINPSIRSIVAYNTDSKVINVLRANGILLANVIPQNESGSTDLITGSSSVVQLDAWNWEDAGYRMDGNIHFNMPSLVARTGRRQFFNAEPQADPVKLAMDRIDKVRSFFQEAQSYLSEGSHSETNLKFEAVKNLFNKKQKLFIHCNIVKEMLLAMDLAHQFKFNVVIVGGADSWMIADLLKQNNIPVILGESHALPSSFDDDVDQPYKTPYLLQKAGVLFAITDLNEETRGRNLMFNAGTAAAYGLTKEEALTAITLNAAKILGIDDLTGTIEVGKDANIVVSQGDILDMKSSILTHAFIQGREINLNNKQTELYDRYKYKYGLN